MIYEGLCTKVDYLSLRYGILIHWVSGENGTNNTALLNSHDEKVYGISNFCDSVNVEKVCDDIAKMGFEIVSFTNFHGGGVTLHPSSAIDKWRGEGAFTSKRDLLRELIDALKKRNIYTAIFTHPLDGHDFSKEQQELLGWNDPTDNYKKWNDFINDVYDEIALKYGKDLISIGFDSEWGQTDNFEWQGKLDLVRLKKTIHNHVPHLPLVSLSPSNDTTGYSIREVWRPSWLDPWMSRGNKSSDYVGDYDVWDWPCYCRPVSAVITKHWTTITKKEDIVLYLNGKDLFRYFIFQLSCATEGPAIMWGNSPYSDGGWETGVEEAFLEVNTFIEPIKNSVIGTLPSTSYYTSEGTVLRDISNGLVAVRSYDDSKEYFHILIPPQNNIISMPCPSDNKIFESAKILNSTYDINFRQNENGLELIFPKDYIFDELCTTIELTVAANSIKKKSLGFHKGVLFSTSFVSDNLQNCPYTNCRLVDGTTKYVHKKTAWSTDNGGWRSKNGDERPFVKVDLFEEKDFEMVVLHPSLPNENSYDGLPLDFLIEISSDNLDYKTVFSKTGQIETDMPIICSIKRSLARYIKVTGTKLRGDYFSLAELEIF